MSSNKFTEMESKLLEFKAKVPKFDALIKTSIAFANAAGGRIIIGVDDITREVIGVTDADRLKIYDGFPNSLYDSVSPNLIAQIYEQHYDEGSVLIIEIPASPKKPYFIKNKGITNGTYIRVGSSTRKANQEYIEDLVREAQRINYDEEIVPCKTNVLSQELLKAFYGVKITTKRLFADKIIAANHANKDQSAPTVAGVLMFSESPDDYVAESLIRCTRFSGIEGRDIVQTLDITGPIEQQAAEGLRVICTWLMRDYSLVGAKLVGKLPIPKEAIREALNNALLHRKYSIPGAIKVAIYDDRMEIFNPGCFPGLVDINSLGDGTTYLRNPTLVRLAYMLHMIETRGTGIQLIYSSCKKAGIKKPEFHEEGDFVKLIFFFEPDIEQFDTINDAIVEYIKLRHNVNAQQIADLLSVSRNTALRKLADLVKLGKIKKIGKGPSVRYTL